MFGFVMSLLAMLSNFGGPDLIIILLIVLVLFGAKNRPDLARGMGQAVKEFQKAKDEFTDELHNAGKTAEKPDVRAAIATPARYAAPGHYPTEYRVYWNESTKEYRVALAGLVERN